MCERENMIIIACLSEGTRRRHERKYILSVYEGNKTKSTISCKIIGERE
jgi:hypothetical protein